MHYESLLPLDARKLNKSYMLDPTQYIHEITDKNQICLHHTASGPGVSGDYKGWIQDTKRIATHFIISREGHIYLMLPENLWAHHLGVKKSHFSKHKVEKMTNTFLNQECIGIEIDSWGPLVEYQGNAYSWTGTKVDFSQTISYTDPFKEIPNSEFFQKLKAVGKPATLYEAYTEKQIAAVYQLVNYLSQKWEIPIKNDGNLFEVSKDALSAVPGIYTHNSYREDKQDIHPQPSMIEMLQQLKNNF